MKISLLVADDHDIVRKGLCALLATETDIEVVGEAADGGEAVDLARRLKPDVVLMDLVMAGVDGVEATRRIREAGLRSHVLVLTSFGSDDKLFPAIRAGAVGYLLKDASPEQLVSAVRRAARGQSALDPAVARRLLTRLRDDADGGWRESLTGREVDVLRELAHGLRNEQIGERLGIGEATVRTHVSHILSKLDVENRTQAVLLALRLGLSSVEEIEV